MLWWKIQHTVIICPEFPHGPHAQYVTLPLLFLSSLSLLRDNKIILFLTLCPSLFPQPEPRLQKPGLTSCEEFEPVNHFSPCSSPWEHWSHLINSQRPRDGIGWCIKEAPGHALGSARQWSRDELSRKPAELHRNCWKNERKAVHLLFISAVTGELCGSQTRFWSTGKEFTWRPTNDVMLCAALNIITLWLLFSSPEFEPTSTRWDPQRAVLRLRREGAAGEGCRHRQDVGGAAVGLLRPQQLGTGGERKHPGASLQRPREDLKALVEPEQEGQDEELLRGSAGEDRLL